MLYLSNIIKIIINEKIKLIDTKNRFPEEINTDV